MPAVRTPRVSRKGLTYTRTIFAAASGAETEIDAAASIQVPSDSFLVAITGCLNVTGAADTDYGIAELSTSGNFQGLVNEVADTIMLLWDIFKFNVNGMSQGHVALAVSGIKIPFAAGERIFVNIGKTTLRVVQATFTCHFQER